MPDEYEVGFVYLKQDGETDAVLFRVEADSPEGAKSNAEFRFKKAFPANYQISLHHISEISYHPYGVWFDTSEKKGQVVHYFIPEATSDLEALQMTERLFWADHDSRKITVIKKEVSRFRN